MPDAKELIERLREFTCPDCDYIPLITGEAADTIASLQRREEMLREQMQRIEDHYVARSELYTSDEECAAGMASIARQALEDTDNA